MSESQLPQRTHGLTWWHVIAGAIVGAAVCVAIMLALVRDRALGAASQRHAGDVLYQDPDQSGKSATRMTKVTVIQELPDALVLDIDYVFLPQPEQSAVLSVMPDMDGWYFTQTAVVPGRHTASLMVGLRSEVHEVARSHNLTLGIGVYSKDKFEGNVFQRILPLAKSWRHQS